MYEPHNNENSNVGGFLTGLLCGAALCAAGVFLFAPKAAEEIRRKLNDSVSKGREAVDLGRQAFDEVRETATEQGKVLYNQGRQAVSDIAAHSKGVS